MNELDIKLNINSSVAKPDDILSKSILKSAGFKRVGFIGKLLLRRGWGQLVFHVAGCKASYLEDSNIIIPNPYLPYESELNNLEDVDNLKELEAELQAKYSNKYKSPDFKGIQYYCDTSAYYFLGNDYSLREINFQLLNNIYLAGDEYGKFVHLCNAKYGQASYFYNGTAVKKSGPGIMAGWAGEKSSIYAHLSIDEEHFMIIWLSQKYNRYQEFYK